MKTYASRNWRALLNPVRNRLLLGSSSLLLAIPLAHLFGWFSYGSLTTRRSGFLDYAIVMSVAGVWGGAHERWKLNGEPVLAPVQHPTVQLPFMQRAVGFIIALAVQLALLLAYGWIYNNVLRPLRLDDVMFATLFPLGGGFVFGISLASRNPPVGGRISPD